MSERPADATLETEALVKSYGPRTVVNGVNLRFRSGEVVGLLGANGAGKTTTLRAICGMCRVQGSLTLAGQSILGMATEDVIRLGVAHVPDGRGTEIEWSGGFDATSRIAGACWSAVLRHGIVRSIASAECGHVPSWCG